jgi:hypothetical protein
MGIVFGVGRQLSPRAIELLSIFRTRWEADRLS